MRLPDEPGYPVLPPGQPTRDLLLAQALDACITAERRLPGSSQEIIARQPAWARGELQRLVGLAGSLDAATSNAIMSSEFRVAARARLMQRIGGDASLPVTTKGNVDGHTLAESRLTRPPSVAPLSTVSSSHGSPVSVRRKLVWAWRVTACMLAAVLALAATLTASASALPGEPLYGLKEAQEELAVRLATDDQQRSLALLQQANARLDETARLLQQGRTLDATATALRYDQVVQRATMSYVGTIDDTRGSAPATVHMEASLSQDQDQLQALLQSAPEPARADLREALVATERGRALVAEVRPIEPAQGRSTGRAESSVAAAVPTMAAEDEPAPTVVPTVPVENATPIPTRRPAVVLPTATPAVVLADEQDDTAGADTTPVVAQVGGFVGTDDSHGTARTEDGGQVAPPANAVNQGTVNQGPGSSQRTEVALVSPTVVPQNEPQDTPDTSFAVTARSGGGGDDHPQREDRTDLAAQINGRPAAGPVANADSRVTVSNPGEADRNGRGPDAPQTVVAHQVQEPSAGAMTDGRGSTGGRSNGGDDAGATARSAPAQVAILPERATTVSSSSTTSAASGSTSTTSAASTSSASSSNSSDRISRDNGGGDGRVSPTPQDTATKTPSTSVSASTSTQATSGPAVSTSRRGSDGGDPARGDSEQKSNSAARNTGGGDRSSSDNGR